MRFTTNEVDTFSLYEDKVLVGTIHFSIDTTCNTYIIECVELNPDFQYQGFGNMLMQTFIEQLHRKEVKVFPTCPYAKKHLEKHPVHFVDWTYSKK